MNGRRTVGALFCVVSLVAGGCSQTGQQQNAPEGAFFGLGGAGDNLYVAVVTDGNRVQAYACDGETVSEWFVGAVNESRIELTNASSATLSVERGGDSSFDGTLEVGGQQVALSVTRGDVLETRFDEQAVTRATLNRSVMEFGGEQYVGGWIVLPDGSQRGAINAPDGSRMFLDIDINTLNAEVPGLGTFEAFEVTPATLP